MTSFISKSFRLFLGLFAIFRTRVDSLPLTFNARILQLFGWWHKQEFSKIFWPVANFTNNLQAAFALISFYQKISHPNCKHSKLAQNTFVQKLVSHPETNPTRELVSHYLMLCDYKITLQQLNPKWMNTLLRNYFLTLHPDISRSKY